MHIAQLNLTISADKYAYKGNGNYIPVFQDALKAIAREKSISGATKDVLLYILSITELDNRVSINVKNISEELGRNPATVYEAIKTLLKMNILCNKTNSRSYQVSLELVDSINPRLAFRGITTKFNKNTLPELLKSDGKTPLIPGAIRIPSLFDDDTLSSPDNQ